MYQAYQRNFFFLSSLINCIEPVLILPLKANKLSRVFTNIWQNNFTFSAKTHSFLDKYLYHILEHIMISHQKFSNFTCYKQKRIDNAKCHHSNTSMCTHTHTHSPIPGNSHKKTKIVLSDSRAMFPLFSVSVRGKVVLERHIFMPKCLNFFSQILPKTRTKSVLFET